MPPMIIGYGPRTAESIASAIGTPPKKVRSIKACFDRRNCTTNSMPIVPFASNAPVIVREMERSNVPHQSRSEYAADGRDDKRRGHQQNRPQPEHQAARPPPAAIFFFRVSQTLRTSDVINEPSSICRK